MCLFESLDSMEGRMSCFDHATNCFARDFIPAFAERKSPPVLHMQQFHHLISGSLSGGSRSSAIDYRFMNSNI